MDSYTRQDLVWITISLGLTVFVSWAHWGQPGSLWRGLLFMAMTSTLIASLWLRARIPPPLCPSGSGRYSTRSCLT